jgi:hypothetical protein
MLLSRLLGVMLFLPEQTQRAQAAVKMHLPDGGRNFKTRKAKPIRPPYTFGFDYPQRKL